MSGAKFFVWGGGRWRELSPSGRISGWGRARFVAAAGGRLSRCKRSAVLRGLRALADGRPTTVHDGPPLSQIRLQPEPERVQRSRDVCKQCMPCCYHRMPISAPALDLNHAAAAPRSSGAIFDRLLKSTVTSRTSIVSTADACVQVSSNIDVTRGAAAPAERKSRGAPEQNRVQNNKHRHETQPRPNNKHLSVSKVEAETSKKLGPSKKRSRPKRSARARPVTDTESSVCKELVIGEEDVQLLRRFIERQDERNPPLKVDLLAFDMDDEYKRRVFFHLNPIVNVERSARVERMLRERRSHTRDASQVSLKDFAYVLGLQSVEERTSQETGGRLAGIVSRPKRKRLDRADRSVDALATSDTDKENVSEPRRRRVKRTKVLQENDRHSVDANVEASDVKKRPPTWRAGSVVKNNKANGEIRRERSRLAKNAPRTRGKEGDARNEPVPGATKVSSPSRGSAKTVAEVKQVRRSGREYSALEDAAILRWVGGGGRARLVNGNRLWRELQPLHHQRTGHFRSWHSLRNRYLRSLLPQLPQHVSLAEAARLRAAAATGEIKSRKSRRNSIFKEPRVQSAWTQRPRVLSSPRPPRHSSSSSRSRSPRPPRPSSPPSRLRTSRPQRSQPPLRSSFSVSSLEMSYPSSDSEKPLQRRDSRLRQINTSKSETMRTLRSSAAMSAQRTPTYSELTRRFASSRSRSARPSHSSPSSTPRPAHSKSSPRPRNRRLFNAQLAI